MKKILGVLLAVIVFGTSQAYAGPLTLTASSGNLAASVTFAASGTNLIVTLTNTSSADVLVPADLLTAVFFDVLGSGLTPVSAVLASGSTVFFGSDGAGNVGGEWEYLSGISGPLGASEGISSAGFGIFGDFNFGGANLGGPDAVNGMQYGITSAGDNTATGNAAVTGGNELIQSSVVFTLSGLTAGFDPSAAGAITNVSFQYGTSLTEPNIPWRPDNPVPEPGTLLLLGSGLLGLGILRRKNRR